MKELKELLAQYKTTREFAKEVREGYRVGIEKLLKEVFGSEVSFRYGGSLAKGTANTIDCDIDLLCYLDYDSKLTVKEIYIKALEALEEDYYLQLKNSSIKIHQKHDESWDYKVDVVPGKYSTNVESGNVYLWRREDNAKLMTNPKEQINLIKESESKEVIRLIKLYREFNNFEFKSFFLELFAVQIVEPNYADGDSIQDKLIKFCSMYDEIGKKKVNDPANSNNNIMEIHNESDFENIRQKIKKLYEALVTDDAETIVNCILGNNYNIEEAYKNSSFRNNKNNLLQLKDLNIHPFSIKSYIDESERLRPFSSYDILSKGKNLCFKIISPLMTQEIEDVKWIIANSGYEARTGDELRGDKFEDSEEENNLVVREGYTRRETTKFHGNHFVQAVIYTKKKAIFYSNILTVKIR